MTPTTLTSTVFTDEWQRALWPTERRVGQEHRGESSFADRPAWVDTVETAYSAATPYSTEASDTASGISDPYRRMALTFVEPLLRYATTQFRSAVAYGGDVPLHAEQPEAIFLPSLQDTLIASTGRTLITALHAARDAGRLIGDTPEARFGSFCMLLRDENYAAELLREYPVLARQVAVRTEQWLATTIEFLNHLRADWPSITTLFSGGTEPGRLLRCKSGAGDAHRDGRSVRVVEFESGLRLVYKPRSMAVDLHFGEIVDWLNQQGFEPLLRNVRILARRGYGWSEFIDNTTCESADEIDRFYRRQGGLLALLYAVYGTDFHMENLIAAGEHPFLIDLEALFHPKFVASSDDAVSSVTAYYLMSDSVLGVGLLPQRGGGSSPLAKYDASGMGGGVSMSPFRVFKLEAAGTDQMRIVREHIELPASKNRPKLNDGSVNAFEHAEAIAQGFSDAYRLVQNGRAELTRAGGLLDRFEDAEIRIVLRATRIYARVLMEATHPSLLKDAKDLDALLQRVERTGANKPHLGAVLGEEIADLQDGCVPMFVSRPGSRDLWSSRGVKFTDFIKRPTLQDARQRVLSMDDADHARQSWFIRASLASASIDGTTGGNRFLPRESQIGVLELRPVDQRELVRLATVMGDRLDTMAFRDAGATSWATIELAGEEYWALRPVSMDMYQGTAGIALFLGYLGHITNQQRFTDIALALAEQTRVDLTKEMAQGGFSTIGPFGGWSGWLYVLPHLAEIAKAPALLDIAHDIRVRTVERISDDETLDVIGGAAGLLLALASHYDIDPHPDIMRDLVRCADHLVAKAQHAAAGVAWQTDMPASAPLTGFSHGASGIAFALMRAGELIGDPVYLDVARGAMDYERAVFKHDLGNWPDFREASAASAELAWCHGAPGIGLARLHALRHWDDPLIALDLRHAIAATLEYPFGRTHSLCHGDFGNIELLHRASLALPEPGDLAARTNAIVQRVIASLREFGPICGSPRGVEVPGMMCGIAGIGMSLLRLAYPARIPTPLTLDSPKFTLSTLNHAQTLRRPNVE